jgi:very-short-patch-repair endonuclease
MSDNNIIYVNYGTPEGYNGEKYAMAHFPEKDTLVWPYRVCKIVRRAHEEGLLENAFKSAFSSYLRVLGNAVLQTQAGCSPYRMDIALVDEASGKNIRIDVEVDEPYDGVTRKPSHFKGCGDDFRDAYFNHLGWIVVRFSENQVHHDLNGCMAFIAKLLHSLNPDFQISESLLNTPIPVQEQRWTLAEAQKWSNERRREQYLKCDFPQGMSPLIDYSKRELTDNEASLLKEVEPISFQQTIPLDSELSDEDFESDNIKGYNLANKFSRDDQIKFESARHIYTWNGMVFKAVSNIIAEYFPVFDVIGKSEKRARYQNRPAEEIREEWDCKGAAAREIGTFMHRQIENHYLGNPVETSLDFSFDGKYVKESQTVRIEKEMGFFNNFVNDLKLEPYRTEWRIFDTSLKIAGTIDFITKNDDGTFEIYDWKRSEKIFDKSVWGYALGGLSHLADTALNHYRLQQNIYKYILEKNYGIKVSGMHLVALHPDNPNGNYKIVDIDPMPKEMDFIMKALDSFPAEDQH